MEPQALPRGTPRLIAMLPDYAYEYWFGKLPIQLCVAWQREYLHASRCALEIKVIGSACLGVQAALGAALSLPSSMRMGHITSQRNLDWSFQSMDGM